MVFQRFLERMNRVLTPIGMAAILFMTMVVASNVFGRAFFKTPVYGAVEIIELTGAVMLSFIVAYTQFTRNNVNVSVVFDKMSPGWQGICSRLTMFLSLVAVAILIWAGFVCATEMTVAGEKTSIFEIARYPFRYVWVLGCLTLFIVLAAQFIGSLVNVVKK